MTRRTRAVLTQNPLYDQRPTTMPQVDGGAFENRPQGPPIEGLSRFLDSLYSSDRKSLYLLSIQIDEHVRQMLSDWWESAPEYVERTAALMERRKDLFKGKLGFKPGDLLSRLRRVKTLALVVDQLEDLLGHAKDTLLVERSDLMRMSDIVVTETELQMQRPALAREARQELETLAAGPLAIWRARQERIRKRQARNEQRRSEQEGPGAQRRAGEAEPSERLRGGAAAEAVVPETPSKKTAARPLPNKNRRRRGR